MTVPRANVWFFKRTRFSHIEAQQSLLKTATHKNLVMCLQYTVSQAKLCPI